MPDITNEMKGDVNKLAGAIEKDIEGSKDLNMHAITDEMRKEFDELVGYIEKDINDEDMRYFDLELLELYEYVDFDNLIEYYEAFKRLTQEHINKENNKRNDKERININLDSLVSAEELDEEGYVISVEVGLKSVLNYMLEVIKENNLEYIKTNGLHFIFPSEKESEQKSEEEPKEKPRLNDTGFQIHKGKLIPQIIDKLAAAAELSQHELLIIHDHFYGEVRDGIEVNVLKQEVVDYIEEKYSARKEEIFSKLSKTVATIVSTIIDENSQRCLGKMTRGGPLKFEDKEFIMRNHRSFIAYMEKTKEFLLAALNKESDILGGESTEKLPLSSESTIAVIGKIMTKQNLAPNEKQYISDNKAEIEQSINTQTDNIISQADEIFKDMSEQEEKAEESVEKAEEAASEVRGEELQEGEAIEFDEFDEFTADFLLALREKALKELEERNIDNKYEKEIGELRILLPESTKQIIELIPKELEGKLTLEYLLDERMGRLLKEQEENIEDKKDSIKENIKANIEKLKGNLPLERSPENSPVKQKKSIKKKIIANIKKTFSRFKRLIPGISSAQSAAEIQDQMKNNAALDDASGRIIDDKEIGEMALLSQKVDEAVAQGNRDFKYEEEKQKQEVKTTKKEPEKSSSAAEQYKGMSREEAWKQYEQGLKKYRNDIMGYFERNSDKPTERIRTLEKVQKDLEKIVDKPASEMVKGLIGEILEQHNKLTHAERIEARGNEVSSGPTR